MMWSFREKKSYMKVILLVTLLNYVIVYLAVFQQSGQHENINYIIVEKIEKRRNTEEPSNVFEEESKKVESPTIYVITPTYPRPQQIAELTKTAQTLMLVPNAFWIVAEDAQSPTEAVISLLEGCSLPYVYLRAEMPKRYKGSKLKPKGVVNRLAGIAWIRQHADDGVLYFADDDNTYDIRLFDDIRSTKKVSMFPVGLIGSYGVSSPIVKNGKVVGFFDGWIGGRKFAVDMAGFAVSIQYFKKFPSATMPFKPGHEEDGFLKNLNLSLEDIEPKAENCTQIWAWHTQAKKLRRFVKPKMRNNLLDSNIPEILKELWINL